MQEPRREAEEGASQACAEQLRHAPEAFSDAYLRFAPVLRKIAIGKFRIPPADAEALVHDVFATYFSNSGEVRVLEPYLIGAICNASRHYWRRTNASNALFCSEVPCAATPGDALIEEIGRKRLLSTLLARVGKRCRAIMYSYYVDGETTSAIAESMRIRPSTVLIFLSKCRKQALLAYRSLVGRA